MGATGNNPSIANPAATPTIVSHGPDVHGPLRVVPEGSPELTGADLREHDRDARFLVQEIGCGLARSLAHREAAHHSPSGISATTTVGRTSSRAVSAASSAG